MDKYVVAMCRSIYEDTILDCVEAEHPHDAVTKVLDKHNVVCQNTEHLDLDAFVTKVSEDTGYCIKCIACLP